MTQETLLDAYFFLVFSLHCPRVCFLSFHVPFLYSKQNKQRDCVLVSLRVHRPQWRPGSTQESLSGSTEHSVRVPKGSLRGRLSRASVLAAPGVPPGDGAAGGSGRGWSGRGAGQPMWICSLMLYSPPRSPVHGKKKSFSLPTCYCSRFPGSVFVPSVFERFARHPFYIGMEL